VKARAVYTIISQNARYF